MRKNLFLTLALAFASFAGAYAQDWSVSLGTGDGLPGYDAQKGATTVQVFKSGVITPSEALTTLRLTVAETKSNAKNEGGFYFTALSELVVYAADGETVIPYTATSNADHNTSSSSADGAGLPALNDGDWSNYWHSCWAKDVIIDEYHHLELKFDSPVSEFVIEWGARPGNPKDAPTLVGLTKGGVDYIPYADLEWTFNEDEEITSMEQLEDAQYIVMKSNVPFEYNTYCKDPQGENGYKFGEIMDKDNEPKLGEGPKFVMPGSQSLEVIPSYAIELIPTDGGYIFYYPMLGEYLSKNPVDNGHNNLNGAQGKTSNINDAAIVNIEIIDGRFEMWYMMEYEGEELKIHMGATPSTSGFRNVKEEYYNFYKNGDGDKFQGPQLFSEGYGYILAFDWTLYAATMNCPTKNVKIPLHNTLRDAKSIYTYMDSVAVEGYEDEHEAIKTAIEEVTDRLATDYYADKTKVSEDIELLKSTMGAYVFSKIDWYNEIFFPDFEEQYSGMLVGEPEDGMYDQYAYDKYIQENLIDACYTLWEKAEDDPYASLNEMKTFINSVQTNIDNFLASKYEFISLPVTYTSKDPHYTPLGTKNGDHWDWTQQVILAEGEGVTGIRLTFVETNVGSAASDGKYKGYAMVALSGLEILDENDEPLELTADNVSTNSLETAEGSLANLFDNDVTTFYHSIWGNGTMSPEGYVYLDIQFPEGVSLSTFTIKTIGRDNASLAPGTVAVTKYGDVYDPLLDRPNPYNVAKIAQVAWNEEIEEGLYIISGNLRVKSQKNTLPRYYSGATPYHTNEKAAVNDTCVYYFKKAGDAWNIISLSKAQYFALNKEVKEEEDEESGETVTKTIWSTGLTVYPSEAAPIKIKPSDNLKNTFVLYSDIEDHNIDASWSWTNKDNANDSIRIEKATVNANKFVFMDWDGSLAGRPCVSEIPGLFEYGLDVINGHAMADEIKMGDGYDAGDYLHFNKANGEGEWNLYKVTMDTPEFYWATNIPAIIESLALVTGNDPGCIVGDIAELENAITGVETVVAEEKKESAKAAVEAFYANVETAKEVKRVEIIDGAWYAIESAYTEYYKQQGKVKAIYATEDGLSWKDAPAEYNKSTAEFVFCFEKWDIENTKYDIAASFADCAYRIYSDKAEGYFGIGGATTQVSIETSFSAPVYAVKPLSGNIFTIHICSEKVEDPLHTAGHGNGAGAGGTIVNWGGGAGTASSWTLRFVDDAEGTNSIADLVVEGDEVVSVAYFTPSGAAIPAPVSGVNIVVTVYSNGVIETKKILVK